MTDEEAQIGDKFGGVVEQEPITILIVDDYEALRSATRMILGVMPDMPPNLRFVEAIDGQDGLSKYMSENPDVIITDRNMPNKNGFEMVRNIRTILDNNIDGKVPLIFMQSALGDETRESYLRKAQEVGIDKAYDKGDAMNMCQEIAAKIREIAEQRSKPVVVASSEVGEKLDHLK